jgi:hypothetical protein
MTRPSRPGRSGRILLPTLVAFAMGCAARADSSGSPQLQQDAAGAGADASSAPSRRICDGSDGIRLAHWVGGGGTQAAFTAILYELGWEFLYVDGHCHYWVRQPSPPVGPDPLYFDSFPYREGVLTTHQESTLHDLLSYDDFARGAPPCPRANSGTTDASTEMLWDGVKAHSCYAGWQVDPSWPMRSELFASGTPVTGAMRVESGQNSIPDSAPIYPWPLATPVTNYEVPVLKSFASGQSALVADPTETAALRRLRDRAIAEATIAGYPDGAIAVQPKGYVVTVRDDLPFTRRSDGLWVPQ